MIDYARLIRFVLERVVEDGDELDVEVRPHGRTTIVEVSVSDRDAGRVIGRGGRNIDALRAVVRAAGLRHHDRVQVELARRG